MSFIEFLKGIFSPKKQVEVPVSVDLELKAKDFPPLVNPEAPAQTEELGLPAQPQDAPQQTAQEQAPAETAKTVKEIKSKTKKEAPDATAKPKPKAKPKQGGGPGKSTGKPGDK